MPPLKKNENLKLKSHVDSKFHLDLLDTTCSKNEVILKLQSLFKTEDTKEQLIILKEVCCGLKDTDIGQNEENKSLEILANIYLNCKMKHPVKRMLARMAEYVQAEVVPLHLLLHMTFINSGKVSLKSYLVEQVLLKQSLCLQEKNNIDGLRRNIDIISGLMENFVFGEECIKSIAVSVIGFLCEVLSRFIDLYKLEMSPMQQNEIMHHCLATVNTANRMLQKCQIELKTAIDDNCFKIIESISTDMISSDVKIILQDSFMLDVRCSCSMNIVLLLRINFQQSAVFQLLKYVLRLMPIGQEDMPSWLQKTGILSLSPQETVSLSSQLCLYNGLLSLLELSDLGLEYKKGKCLLTDFFLEKFLSFGNSCEDTNGKLLAAKSVTLWTVRASSCIEAGVLSLTLLRRLEGAGLLLQSILQYVWNSWEDPVDHIRINSIELFQNILKLHTLVVNRGITNDKFIHELCKSLLFEISWSCKGKYGTLAALASFTGASYFLHLNSDLPCDILNQMKEQTLSCHACDLFEKISTEHYLELCSTNSILDDKYAKTVSCLNWFTKWVDPVLKILAGTNITHKTHVIEYILPKLLKSGRGTLEYMIKQLTEDSQIQNHSDTCIFYSSGHIGALITCLRRARVIGLLRQVHVNSNSDDHLYGVVEKHVIKQALDNSEEQVRLDALALLCENHKTSELIVKLEFDLVRYFIPWNLNNQSPSFRQLLVSHLKKFLNRYKESEGVLLRQIKKYIADSSEYRQTCDFMCYYQEFLSWLVKHLFHCLYPGSAFARRTTCLALLSLIVDLFGTVTLKGEKHRPFCILDHLCKNNVQILIECLTDTFEENKIEVFKMIQYCTRNGLCIKDPVELTHLLQVALQLAGSTRPQDSTTGAYLFKVILLHSDIYNILTQCMDIVKPYLVTGKFHEINLPLVDNNQSGRSLLLLQILLSCLQDQLEVAKNNLIMAAANRPLYPTLQCIRYLLCDVNLRNIPESQFFTYWKTFINSLLACTLEISEVVSPVVQNSSPEGNVPVEAIKESNSKLESILKSGVEEKSLMLEAEKSKEMVMLMPEYLVVCCWRSIKEVSLLLGQLTVTSPITDGSWTDTETGLLSLQQILGIGEYFTKQLLESYHRGAFELAYAGFVKMCDMLWKSNMSDLHQLPSSWMSNLMEDIKSADGSSKLCATRRSAGVPFYVQAIVTTQPVLTGRICFKHVMTELLNLAIPDYEDTPELSDSQVHALNILRTLFRDTRLGDDVSPFIAKGVKASILGFQSPFWTVRNAATLLLSSLITRIFGVKRSKDETNISKKNCKTGRAFFHRYPSLYKFLLDQLHGATENISGNDGVIHLHPALYPILLILGRLFPSPMEGADTSFNLASFIPHIIRCSSSPVLKTRIMAGKALHPLVHKDQLVSVFETIFHQLPKTRDKSCSQSHIHGLLLQIQHLMNIIPTIGSSLKQSTWTKIIMLWSQRLWLISSENPCYISRQEAIKITFEIIQKSDIDMNEELNTSIQHSLLNIIHSEREIFKYEDHIFIPGFSDFLSTVGIVTIAICLNGDNTMLTDGNLKYFEIENILLILLNSTCYEVRIMGLRFIKLFFEMESEEEKDDQADIYFDEDIYRIITKCERKFKDIVCYSTRILEKCLQMALKEEWHHECQYEVFQVLKEHSILQDTVWPFLGDAVTPYMVLARCIKMIQVFTRDEVKSAVIEFTGCVVCHLVNRYIQRVDDITMEQIHKQLSDWIIVLQHCSRTEQSENLQISCVKVIVNNTKLLLEDEDNLIGDYKFSFWSILVDLLQEDDLEVKVIAASVLTKFSTISKVTVHPLLALDMLINVMVRLHGNTNVKACFDVMVSWLNGRNTETNDQDERLFDRGEMNTYREDVIVMQLIIRHIVWFILKLHDIQNQQQQKSDVLSNDLSSDEETNRKQQKYTDTQVNSKSLCQLGQKLENLTLTDGSRGLALCHSCTINEGTVEGVSCQHDIDIDALRQLCVIFSNHYSNDAFTDSLENQIRNLTDHVYTKPLKDYSNIISNIFCDFLMVQEKKIFSDTDLSHMSLLNESGSYQCLVLNIYKTLIAIHLCCSIKCNTVKHLCDDLLNRLHVMFIKTSVLSNSLIVPLLTLKAE